MKNSASFTSTPIPPKDGLKIIASVIALFQPVADAINPPLRFALKLDPTHPYLTERVSKAIIEAFGLGLCSKGSMAGRIAIPIRNEKGELVAYAGRWPGDDWPEGEDKYKLPTGFQKHRVLFNLDRVLDARASRHR